MVSAVAPQSTEQTHFVKQEASCSSKPASNKVFTSELDSVRPEQSLIQIKDTQNPLETGNGSEPEDTKPGIL